MFPAWNPLSLSGTPFYASGQTGLLNPFFIPYWLTPLPFGFGLAAALQLWASAFGMYLFVRALRADALAAIAAGLAFGFGTFHVLWLSAPALVTPFTLLPWMLWRVEVLIRTRDPRDGAWLAVACAVCFLSGHPGNQAIALLGTVVYAAARIALVRPAHAMRLAAASGAAIVVAALISAAATLPTALLVPGSAGELARAEGGDQLPLTALRTLLFPDWWGRYVGERAFVAPNQVGNFKEIAFYAGTAALLLAAVAVSTRRAWRDKLPLLAVAYLGADLALGGPLRWVVLSLPLLGNINITRTTVLVQVGLIALAGLAIAEIQSRRIERGPVVAAAGVLIAVGGAILLTSGTGDLVAAFAGDRPPSSAAPNEDSATSVVWWAGLLVVTTALVLLRETIGTRAVVVALIAVIAVDCVQFARGFRYFPPAAEAFPPRTPGLRWLQANGEGGRIARPQTVLPPNTQMVYGIADVQAYEAPQPDMRFFRLWRRISPDQEYIFPLIIYSLGPDQRQLLNVLGARWLVTPTTRPPIAVRADLPPAPATGLAGTRRVYRGADATILENPAAAPRVFVPRAVNHARSDAQARDMVLDRDMRPPRDAVVQGSPVDAGTGTARITREENSALEVKASMQRAGLLVVNDRLQPGWSVTVDGRPARELYANAVMRGVEVPAGEHTVLWTYRVPGLRAGIAISVFGLLLLAAWFGATRTRRAR